MARLVNSSLTRGLPAAAAAASAVGLWSISSSNSIAAAGCEGGPLHRNESWSTPSPPPLTRRPRQRQHQHYPVGRNFVADAVEKVLPSVISLKVRVGDEVGDGSGFIVSADEVLPSRGKGGVLIITNAHCVMTPKEFHENAQLSATKRVVLDIEEGHQVEGRVIVCDAEKDVALIEPVDEERGQPLVPSGIVDDPSVRHGEFVVAVGAPLRLENSVTVGIVSNPNRRVGSRRYIQTDAVVHTGNSGGPLVNMDGEVIGINAMKIAEGVTYVIPIHDAIEHLRCAYYTGNAANVMMDLVPSASVGLVLPKTGPAVMVGGMKDMKKENQQNEE